MAHPDQAFVESLYEHSDSVVCVQKHHKDASRFLTASKDSSLSIWKFSSDKKHQVDFVTGIEYFQFIQTSFIRMGRITQAKWLDDNSVVVALSDGSIQVKDLSANKKDKCQQIFKTDSSINDMIVWISKTGLRIIVAEDSGRVRLLDPSSSDVSASSVLLAVSYI